MVFDIFIGIDWSGAKACVQKGIAVARIEGDGSVICVPGPHRQKSWCRESVLDYIKSQSAGTAIAFDSSFALPYDPIHKHYLAILRAKNGPDLWKEIDLICHQDPFLGAGSFKEFAADYLLSNKGRGSFFKPLRRQTEKWYNDTFKERCESSYHMIGPSQVGMAALTTMRLLNRLTASAAASVWPFMPVEKDRPVLFETFATSWRIGSRGKVRDGKGLAIYLEKLGTVPHCRDQGMISDDQSDAMLMAAGLRYRLRRSDLNHSDKSAAKGSLFPGVSFSGVSFPGMSGVDKAVLATEGWIVTADPVTKPVE